MYFQNISVNPIISKILIFVTSHLGTLYISIEESDDLWVIDWAHAHKFLATGTVLRDLYVLNLGGWNAAWYQHYMISISNESENIFRFRALGTQARLIIY